jgi:uncharacterized protein YggE
MPVPELPEKPAKWRNFGGALSVYNAKAQAGEASPTPGYHNWRTVVNANENRLRVALGSLAAVALLLAAFLVIWLLPRGPVESDARNQTGITATSTTGSQTTDKSSAPGGNASLSVTGAAQGAPVTDQAHISVHGTGIVTAKPDMATIQLGVQIQDVSLNKAQTDAASKMDAIMSQLKSAGIDEKDISTSQYNVEPVMDYRDNQPPVVTGYRVTNIVSVKARDLTKLGKMIDDVVGSGANSLYGISFGFADPTALMRQAREEAMKDARAKAEQLAQLGGVGLGAPLIIDDGGSSVPPVAVPMATAEKSLAAGAATPISPGQQEIRVELSVIYAMK